MIKIGGIEPSSLVDGEGVRFVIFVPGCIHSCEGCHNKLLQNPNFGFTMSQEELKRLIDRKKKFIDGVTISGGDPLFDIDNTLKILKVLPEYNIWLYTGYLFNTIPKEILEVVDVIIDGKYDKSLPAGKFAGSSNQKVYRKNSIGEWMIDGNE